MILIAIEVPGDGGGGPFNGIGVPITHTSPGLATIGSVVPIIIRPVDSAIANVVSIHSLHDINLTTGRPSFHIDGITQHPNRQQKDNNKEEGNDKQQRYLRVSTNQKAGQVPMKTGTLIRASMRPYLQLLCP